MPTMADWQRNWRRIVGGLEPGLYEAIVSRHGNEDYEVLRVSLFDQVIDGDKKFVTTAASDFENGSATYSRRTREMGITRVVTTKGRNWFILEQGTHALEWVAATEGVRPQTLVSVTRSGALGRSIARRVARREKEASAMLEAQVQELQEAIRDSEHETGRLASDLRNAERELARYGME